MFCPITRTLQSNSFALSSNDILFRIVFSTSDKFTLWPPERIEYLVNDAKPIVILTNKNDYSNENTEIIPFASLVISCYEDGNLQQEEMVSEASTDTYAVLYTSGSSGLPKGMFSQTLHTRHKILQNN